MMPSKKKIVATIEARMTSSRLPGKVLKQAAGKPMLELMIERLKRVPSLDQLVVATTVNATDDPVVELADRIGVGSFRGSEDDVLKRVLNAARVHDADIIVELTGDCPLIDPALVEICVQGYLDGDVDYVSNVLERTYPVGMDVQVFATDILADVASRTDDPADHEHVSLYIYRHPELYRLKNFPGPAALTNPGLGLTLDTAQDFELIAQIFDALYVANPAFDLADILNLLEQRPHLLDINNDVRRKHV